MGLFRSSKKDKVEQKLAAEDGTIITALQKIIESGKRFLRNEGEDMSGEKAATDVEIEMEELEERVEKVRAEVKKFKQDVKSASSDAAVAEDLKKTGLSPGRMDEVEGELDHIEKDMEDFREADAAGRIERPLKEFRAKMENDWGPAIQALEEELSI
ncbi:MAG: hypothetical protein ABEJ07_02115 [Candidatus Nanohaloarchaea archaeon]